MIRKYGWCIIAALMLCVCATVHADEARDVDYAYTISVVMFSIQEGSDGLVKDSYRSEGSGGAGVGSRVGLSGGKGDSSFMANIHPVEENGKLFVEVEVESESPSIKPLKQRLAMSDLKPVSLDLTRDDQEKRVHKLTITPTIDRIDRTKKKVDVSTFKLNAWHFDRSRVIVDGWRNAGTIGASGQSLAFVDITGYAKVEFATQPFKGAEPIGELENGKLTIKRKGTLNFQTIEIENVKLGDPPVVLQGGPYEVWVRWSPPSQTIAQAIKELTDFDAESQFANMKMDEATKAKVIEKVRWVKKNIAKLNDEDFASDGTIHNVLISCGMSSGIGPFSPADDVK